MSVSKASGGFAGGVVHGDYLFCELPLIRRIDAEQYERDVEALGRKVADQMHGGRGFLGDCSIHLPSVHYWRSHSDDQFGDVTMVWVGPDDLVVALTFAEFSAIMCAWHRGEVPQQVRALRLPGGGLPDQC